MIDLKKEYNEYLNDNVENTLNKLEELRKEIEIKTYFLTILSTVKKVDELIQNNKNLFLYKDVDALEIRKYYDHEIGFILKYNFVRDSQRSNKYYSNQIDLLKEVFDNLSVEFSHVDLEKDKRIQISIDENLQQNLLNLLLNEELQKSLGYASLDNILANDNKSVTKKNKI